MNVPQPLLDRWAVLAEQVRTAHYAASTAIARGDRREAKRHLDVIHGAALQLLTGTVGAGASKPANLPPEPITPIDRLDTEANRRLAYRLREAADAARAVDEERLGQGVDGVAGILEMMLAECEIEIYGPAGVRE